MPETGSHVRSRPQWLGFPHRRERWHDGQSTGVRSLTAETRPVGTESRSRRCDRNRNGFLRATQRQHGIRRGHLLGLYRGGRDRVDQFAPDNQVAGNRVEARLASFGNGIELFADNPSGAATLAIRAESGAALDLGLIPFDQRDATAVAAQSATASLSFLAPNDTNTGFSVTAAQSGTSFNGYDVVFRDTLAGDTATVTVDAVAQELIVDLDAANTTTNTIITANQR